MKVTLKIDGKEVRAKKGTTVLEAAQGEGLYIPTLCDLSRLESSGSCRLCVVEIEGMRGFPTACTTPVVDGMVVRTESPQLRTLRRNILELTLSEHPYTCLVCDKKDGCDDYQGTIRKVGVTTGCQYCPKNGACELQRLVEYLSVEEIAFPIAYRSLPVEQEDPFFDRDYNLCVLCGRCVRVCNDVRFNGTLTFGFRGDRTVVGTAFGKSHLDVGCEFCGACVDVCPTGALYGKRSKWEGCPDRSVPSVCPYCSVGCSLSFNLKGEGLVSTTPYLDGTLNKGQLCVRGRFAVVDGVYHPERLTTPMIRKDKRWVETTWDTALNVVAEKFSQSKGNGFALVASPQGTNEDAYVLQKFARVAMESNHVTNSSGLSDGEFVDALVMLRNGGAPMASLEDVEKAETLVVWGVDLSVSHPIAALKVKQIQRAGAKLVVVDPRKTKLADRADVHVRLRPGTDRMLIAALLDGILHASEGTSFSDAKGLDVVRRVLKDVDLSSAVKWIGVSKGQIEKLTELFVREKSVVFLFGSGIALQERAAESIFALVDLAMVLKGGKLLPVLGENNLMGCFEMGCHPAVLPGLASVRDKAARQTYAAGWKISRALRGGLDLAGIVRGIEVGKVRTLYAVGDIPRVASLKKLDFLVVQSLFVPDWMKEAADVILPSVHLNEGDGTVTNFEGRVQRVRRVLKPLGQAKPDWWIASQIAQRMDVSGFPFKKTRDVLEEMVSLIPEYRGMTPQRLRKRGLLVWARRGEEKDGLRFRKFAVEEEIKVFAKGYPFTLMVGWNLFRYRNGPLAEIVPGMDRLVSEKRIAIHPEDAQRLEAQDGDSIRIRSKDGLDFEGIVFVTEQVLPKTAYVSGDGCLLGETHPVKRNRYSVKMKKVDDE